MKGNIKMAKVSILYKKKGRGRRLEVIRTKAVEVLIVVKQTETSRVLKSKGRVISRVCRELGLHKDKLIEPNINTIEIIKDLGRTVYDV